MPILQPVGGNPVLVRLMCVIIPGLLLVGSAHAADAKDLEGKYKIKVYVNKKLEGDDSATIVFKGGNTVEVSIQSKKETWVGIGKLEGSRLKITWVKTSGKGRVVDDYEVQKNGNLEIEWKEMGKSR